MGISEVQSRAIEALVELDAKCGSCKKCDLHKHRSQVVLGDGHPEAELMFIGEGPGEQEDKQGRPFVGRSGQLLDKALEAADFARHHVYIANIVKCRPPLNRDPAPEEVEQCMPYLRKQIEIIRPELIVTLGRVAASYLLGRQIKITKERGRYDILPFNDDILVKIVYHPSYVLRNRNTQVEVDFFQDILDARKVAYGEPLNTANTVHAGGA